MSAGILSATVASCSLGYINTLLSPFLEQFHLSVTFIGLSYLAMTIPFTIATPLIGWVSDRLQAPWTINLLGLATIAASFLLVGPAPYLPLASSYLGTIASLPLLGCGIAAVLVSSYSATLSAAVEAGYTHRSNSLVSGVWTAAFSLGNFIGPTVAGLLMDRVGFRGGTAVVQAGAVVMAVAVLCSRCTRKRKRREAYEQLP